MQPTKMRGSLSVNTRESAAFVEETKEGCNGYVSGEKGKREGGSQSTRKREEGGASSPSITKSKKPYLVFGGDTTTRERTNLRKGRKELATSRTIEKGAELPFSLKK